ncbi:MAG: hypothetical protein V8K32_13250 [Candidatus Electrothrix gigas]
MFFFVTDGAAGITCIIFEIIQNKMLYIVTLPNGFFGSAEESWKSLSPEKISFDLKDAGFAVKTVGIDSILQQNLLHNDIVIYTSSEVEDVRNYIKDVMYMVAKRCHIVPSMDALMAHEDKGFQQLYRDYYKFGNVDGGYFYDFASLPCKYPYVYKTTVGAGSSGVTLIQGKKDQNKLKKRFRISLLRTLIKLVRKFQLTSKEYKIYSYRYQGTCSSVYQKFIHGLTGDYKILVFGLKYYVLQRKVKKGGFKASGSGLFYFPEAGEVPDSVLNFAQSIYNFLDVPYASLDIAESSDECYLLEYQATNFGPYTLIKSKGYFVMNDTDWIYVQEKSCLESNFSQALLYYITTITSGHNKE